ncbi:MAG: molybdenum cofactor biosynthesis protein MoaE [Planctomycetota bacterium]|nr:molybdenum cofactor biosynthesis protein MoaE [Planctomycetota bacterium]
MLHFRLTEGPVSGDWVQSQVAGDDSGCTILFLGTVRNHGHGNDVTHLDYEAYSGMVESEVKKIAEEVSAHHEVLRFALEHSFGRVPVGCCSVALAIASAHRKAGFSASIEFMDALKERVPIWKKECYPDGSSWLGKGS